MKSPAIAKARGFLKQPTKDRIMPMIQNIHPITLTQQNITTTFARKGYIPCHAQRIGKTQTDFGGEVGDRRSLHQRTHR